MHGQLVIENWENANQTGQTISFIKYWQTGQNRKSSIFYSPAAARQARQRKIRKNGEGSASVVADLSQSTSVDAI